MVPPEPVVDPRVRDSAIANERRHHPWNGTSGNSPYQIFVRGVSGTSVQALQCVQLGEVREQQEKRPDREWAGAFRCVGGCWLLVE